jgi:hypothetical protein
MLRKALLGAVAGMALLASPAQADFNLYGDVDKNVDIYIWEGVFKLKLAAFLVLIIDNPEKVAKSQVVFNQRNQRNEACENCAEKLDLIAGSINGNSGITTVNQATGNMNNQGNLVSVAWANVGGGPGTTPPDPGVPNDPNNTGHANSQVAGEQILGDGPTGAFVDNPDGTRSHVVSTTNGNTVHTINVPFRDAIIRGSVNDNSGITQVNQASGNINNQANGMSLAFTFYNGIALSDTALGQWNAGNTVDERNVSKFALIANSVNGNSGVTQVNQTAGVLANQSNVVSLAVTGLGLTQ